MEIIAGKIYQNETKYVGCRECKRKVCSCGKNDMGEITITNYRTKVGEIYYTIKGYGASKVQEGDVINGEPSTRTFSKRDGSQGVENIITLPKPDLEAENRALKAKIAELEETILKMTQDMASGGKTEDEPLPEFNEEINDEDVNIDDIPF